MTPRERVLAALAHAPTDICPYLLAFDGEIRKRLVAATGDPTFDRVIMNHAVGVGPGYPNTATRLDATHYRDNFGVIWEQSEADEFGIVREPILKTRDVTGYCFPALNEPGLWDQMPVQLAEHRDQFTVWSLGFSLFERARSMRGQAGFLMDMREAPAFAHDLLERICDLNLALIEQACGFPVDCIRFGDDWGGPQGLVMGAPLWREYIKPYFGRMVAAARRRGKQVLLHSDGDIREIIPDLIEVGLTILNPMQSNVMDIYEIKRTFGRDLAFLGGLSVQHTLPEGSPDDVRREIRALMRELGRGGGYIISPTHSLGPDIPVANLLAMMNAFAKQ